MAARTAKIAILTDEFAVVSPKKVGLTDGRIDSRCRNGQWYSLEGKYNAQFGIPYGDSTGPLPGIFPRKGDLRPGRGGAQRKVILYARQNFKSRKKEETEDCRTS